MSKKVRVRFAPSPTGYLHIGNARTALFNYLVSTKHDGDFILRIEDTDQERSKPEFIDQIYQDLRWLGLEWQEGPDVGGEYGPYLQTSRMEIYQKYVDQLLQEGKAYYCYCTPEELDELRKQQMKEGKSPRYDNRHRALTDEERKEKEAAGIKPVVRFKIEPQEVVIPDIVRGNVTFDTGLLGDLVILRADKSPTYHLAVAVDDGLMEISHVLRGEDHLSNTPKHILLMQAMGFEVPLYGHMPLTMGKGGEPLSKRLGAMSLKEYREHGYRGEALANYMALLGWSPGDDRELFTFEELKKVFSESRITKSPAVFDKVKLDWVSGNHIRKLPDNVYFEESKQFLIQDGFLSEEQFEKQSEQLKKIILTFKEAVACYGELKEKFSLLDDAFDYDDFSILETEGAQAVLKMLHQEIALLETLDFESFQKAMGVVKKETKQKGKGLFMPVRMALTGQMHGPEMHHIVLILEKEGCLKRIERALEKLQCK